MPGGYAKAVIKIDFPELSTDPKADPIWVVIKNPKLLPPKMLRPGREAQAAAVAIREAAEAAQGGEGGEDGAAARVAAAVSPEDAETAESGTAAMAGRLVIAWRVYDPLSSPEVDRLTGETVEGTGQELLPSPSGGGGASAEQFAALPMEIQMAVLTKITEAINPPQAQEGEPTAKTSSSPPSPSTTEPGAEDQSPPS